MRVKKKPAMGQGSQLKQLLSGYVGVKFKTVLISRKLPLEAAEYYEMFNRICTRLKNHQMTPANGGNVSVRFAGGFIISSSGCNLGCIEKNELAVVERCDVQGEKVYYSGPQKPSSESMMHWLIYKNRPESEAIIHAHDELATRPELLAGEIEESIREEPYGTIELAHMAIDTFRREVHIIVLKNHGYVAIGTDLDKACDLVVKTHLRLLRKHRQ
jgi:L-fuculose-phosphate aldolase